MESSDSSVLVGVGVDVSVGVAVDVAVGVLVAVGVGVGVLVGVAPVSRSTWYACLLSRDACHVRSHRGEP